MATGFPQKREGHINQVFAHTVISTNHPHYFMRKRERNALQATSQQPEHLRKLHQGQQEAKLLLSKEVLICWDCFIYSFVYW